MSLSPGENYPSDDPLSANLNLLATQSNELRQEYFARLGAIGDFTPLNSLGEERLKQVEERYRRILDGIDGALPIAQEVMRTAAVVEPVDAKFTEALFVRIIEVGQYEDFITNHLPELVRELTGRNKLNQLESDSQTSAATEISEGRIIKVSQGLDTTKFKLDLPFVVDPRQLPVRLGPDAVTTILGNPITDEDYKIISSLLIDNTLGSANEILLSYEQTVRSWAEELADSGRDYPDLLRDQGQARQAILRAMDVDPYSSEVAVYAIFTAVLRDYPALAHIESPQPYTC